MLKTNANGTKIIEMNEKCNIAINDFSKSQFLTCAIAPITQNSNAQKTAFTNRKIAKNINKNIAKTITIPVTKDIKNGFISLNES